MGFFKKIFSTTSRPAPQQGGIFFTEIQRMLGFDPLNITHYYNSDNQQTLYVIHPSDQRSNRQMCCKVFDIKSIV